jgi:hypothetical protein
MKREWKYPGKCCDCGCDTQSKYRPRCISCGQRKRRGSTTGLPGGFVVDECFQEKVGNLIWRLRGGYAVTRRTENGRVKKIPLHNFIWELSGRTLPALPLTIDHCNRDPKDNRLENLRIATPSLQALNQKDRPKKSGLPRGVSFVPFNGNGKPRVRPYAAKAAGKFIGNFATPEEASAAYEKKREELMSLELSLSSPE